MKKVSAVSLVTRLPIFLTSLQPQLPGARKQVIPRPTRGCFSPISDSDGAGPKPAALKVAPVRPNRLKKCLPHISSGKLPIPARLTFEAAGESSGLVPGGTSVFDFPK